MARSDIGPPGYGADARWLHFEDLLLREADILSFAEERFGAPPLDWDAASRPLWEDRSHIAELFISDGASIPAMARAGCLPAWLHVDQIGALHGGGDGFSSRLLAACASHRLPWSLDNLALLDRLTRAAPDSEASEAILRHYEDDGVLFDSEVLLHRADVHRFLSRYETWPIPAENPLGDWWPELKPGRTESVEPVKMGAASASPPHTYDVDEKPPQAVYERPTAAQRRAATIREVLAILKREKPELDVFQLPEGYKMEIFRRAVALEAQRIASGELLEDARLFKEQGTYLKWWQTEERKAICHTSVRRRPAA
jgi:hypothetical protein